MFQYAFGVSLSQKLNRPLYFDLSFYKQGNHDLTERNFELNRFDIPIEAATDEMIDRFLRPTDFRRVLNKLSLSRTNIYKEKTLRFNSQIFDLKPPVYVDGFWQCEQYFTNREEMIKKSFTFKEPLSEGSQKVAAQIAALPETVSVHVRRGDYVSSKPTNDLHGVCSVEYYKEAMALISKRRDSPHFYFFSDDIQWVSDNLVSDVKNCTLVEHNTGADSWQDMALMSKCKHHIIANSSFSWWGAWLNPSKVKIVIAPEHWFNKKSTYFDDRDLVPWNWIKMPNG